VLQLQPIYYHASEARAIIACGYPTTRWGKGEVGNLVVGNSQGGQEIETMRTSLAGAAPLQRCRFTPVPAASHRFHRILSLLPGRRAERKESALGDGAPYRRAFSSNAQLSNWNALSTARNVPMTRTR
jgi:hypothetical protein